MKAKLFLLVLCFCSQLACEDESFEPKTRAEILTYRRWKCTDVAANNEMTLTMTALAYKGATYDFHSDLNYEIKYSSGAVTGKWRFEDSEAALIWDNGKAYEIVGMSKEVMILRYTHPNYFYTLTFTR
jgi:hypothetical protein